MKRNALLSRSSSASIPDVSAKWPEFHPVLHYCHDQKVHRLQLVPFSTGSYALSFSVALQGWLLLPLVSVGDLGFTTVTSCTRQNYTPCAFLQIDRYKNHTSMTTEPCTWCCMVFAMLTCIYVLECWLITCDCPVKWSFFWPMLSALFLGWKYKNGIVNSIWDQ